MMNMSENWELTDRKSPETTRLKSYEMVSWLVEEWILFFLSVCLWVIDWKWEGDITREQFIHNFASPVLSQQLFLLSTYSLGNLAVP